MAEELPNGTAHSVDVEMKEEAPLETSLSSLQHAPPDNSDPAPAPQQDAVPDNAAAIPEKQPEAVVAAAPTPAIATPPAASTATTRPGSMPPQPAAKHPDKPVAHGGPTRQFLNSNITPHLLEGMKYLAVYEPEKPLAWLAEFLAKRSKEIEG